MHPGDQHLPQNDRSGQPNPYTPTLLSVSRSTAQGIASLQAKLDRQLGPEYISERPGAGGVRVQYLEAWKCINLANEIFGFNGWSSNIQNISVDYMDESRETGRVSLGLSVVVRVTLKDGVYHEDIGYGSIENAKSKAAAFEKCKKEGTTDALKRALRNFGNVLGNCLYDKTYLREVSKIKLPPARFDIDRLHRRPEFAPLPKETKEPDLAKASVSNSPNVQAKVDGDQDLFQDHFDDNYFDDYDFEDRPEIRESPRLDEFDSNSLPVVTPPAAAAAASRVNGTASHQLEPRQQTTTNSRTSPNLVSTACSDQLNRQTIPPAKPNAPPLIHSFSPAESTPQQPNADPQIPPAPAVSFTRLGRDGTPLGPFDAQHGNFSPLTTIKSDKVDYNKSAKVFRTKVQQAKVPLNTSDAHNRMPQPAAIGAGPGGRVIGCPPGRPMYNPSLHARANSGPSSLGIKRNAQGQYVNDSGRISNQVEPSVDSGPKRVKSTVDG